jgi:flagellar operon protein
MKVADLQMNSKIHPIDPSRIEKQRGHGSDNKQPDKTQAFGEVLQKQIRSNTEVRFSAHAIDRIQQRSVALTVDDLARLSNGKKQVQDKGAQNSLILVGETAFVVSVKNNTVVTAVDKADTSNRVFTNIDSVAIV